MKLSKYILTELKENDLQIEHYFVLFCKYEKLPYLMYYRVQEETYTKLIDKGLLTKNKVLSTKGVSFVLSLIHTIPKEKQLDKHFKAFWEAYPVTDDYSHHMGTRTIRTNKKQTRNTYERLIFREDYNPDDIVKSVFKYIYVLAKKSDRTNTNAFTYMVGPSRFLEDYIFETYIPKEKEEVTEVSMKNQESKKPNPNII